VSQQAEVGAEAAEKAAVVVAKEMEAKDAPTGGHSLAGTDTYVSNIL
jgi:hypothetical protein